MPPNGYTTVTIPEGTAEKLAQHELETMSKTIEFAVDSTLGEEQLSKAELAHCCIDGWIRLRPILNR